MDLRPYQKNCLNNTFDSFKINKNVLLCLPTGAGKTIVFTEIAKQYFDIQTKRVLILTHRLELLKQANGKINERTFLINAGVKFIPNDFDFYIGMVETVKNRLDKLPDFGLIIMDECHIGNFKKLPFFKDLNVNILGVTATPISSEPLANYYDKMINNISISDLIRDGYLLNCEAYGFGSLMVGQQNFKVSKGEFNEQQLEDFYSSEYMVNNVIEAYWKYARGKKTLIFNVNINHNDEVYKALWREGLRVFCIDSNTPQNEREQILMDFASYPDAILCNVGVLTTGFDEPSVEYVFLNRATKSLALYLQMIGRGSRPHDSMDKFKVIDLGLNTERHGFYDDVYDWETYFQKGIASSGEGNGVAPIKECPTCAKIQPIKVKVCNECGYDFSEQLKKKEEEERVYTLGLLKKKGALKIETERACKNAEERGYKPYQALYVIVDKCLFMQEKNRSIINDDDVNNMALDELALWCKHYKKQNNKWHKDYIIKILNEKRSKLTTADGDMV